MGGETRQGANERLCVKVFRNYVRGATSLIQTTTVTRRVRLFDCCSGRRGLIFFRGGVRARNRDPQKVRKCLSSLGRGVQDFSERGIRRRLCKVFKLVQRRPCIDVGILEEGFVSVLKVCSLITRSLSNTLRRVRLSNSGYRCRGVVVVRDLERVRG